MSCRLALLCLIAGLASVPAGLSAQTVNGPDNMPLPGSSGGLAIPNPPVLLPPALEPFQGYGDDAKKDMDNHPGQQTGTVKKPAPNGGTATIVWKRTDETHWTYTVTLTYPNGASATLAFEVSTDAKGISHAKATLPPLPGEPHHFGPTYIFIAGDSNCTNLISVMYVQRTDTLLDSAGKTIQTSKLGPGIDGGIPYPVQGNVGGSRMIQDSPGFDIPAGASDQQFAGTEIAALRKQLNVPFDKAGVKGTFEYKYWTYAICTAPVYQVVGHWEWAFTLVVDSKNPPYLTTTGEKEPSWTAGK